MNDHWSFVISDVDHKNPVDSNHYLKQMTSRDWRERVTVVVRTAEYDNMCPDNTNHLFKYIFFLYMLVFFINLYVKNLKFGPKSLSPIFSLFLISLSVTVTTV